MKWGVKLIKITKKERKKGNGQITRKQSIYEKRKEKKVELRKLIFYPFIIPISTSTPTTQSLASRISDFLAQKSNPERKIGNICFSNKHYLTTCFHICMSGIIKCVVWEKLILESVVIDWYLLNIAQGQMKEKNQQRKIKLRQFWPTLPVSIENFVLAHLLSLTSNST